MADPTRLKRAANGRWLAGCCAVGVSLLLTVQAHAAVTITVGSGDGFPGGTLPLSVGLTEDAGDPVVGNVQLDIIFDTTQLQLSGACLNGGSQCGSSPLNPNCGQENSCTPATCSLDPRLTQQLPNFSLPSPPGVPAGQQHLRLAVFDDIQHPNASISPGPLFSCIFDVSSTALPNQPVFLMTDRLSVGTANPPYPTIPVGPPVVTPGMIVTAPPPTVTPTPPIPCSADRNCPLGQVCDPATHVCKPAPTPTPTIACPDGTCPAPLTCVNGICVDLSTPTVTPTPLPTCTSDGDCMSGFQCRAGVCVPIRQCSNTEPTPGLSNCVMGRESCVDGQCECGGDCNLDGFVYGDEITKMTCILSGDPACKLSDCPAGDFNGDGSITGNEVCMAVRYNLGLGCPVEAQALIFSVDPTPGTASLDITAGSGLPGTDVQVAVSLGLPTPPPQETPPAEGTPNVATAQLDLLFDTTVLDIPDPATACTIDPRLTATNTSFTFLPQTPTTPPGQGRLRLFVGELNLCSETALPSIQAFDQGPLLSCTFHIKTSAPGGASPLTVERLNIGDPHGIDFTATTNCPPGMVPPADACNVTVQQLTPTATDTPVATPTNTLTPVATNTATAVLTSTATNTATATATATAESTITSTATPTNTPRPTSTNTPKNTPTASPTNTAPQGGGGGGGCNIEPVGTGTGTATLLWLAPLGLMLWRRRYRR